ncbi:MAG: hypothetical protein OXI27_07765 [Thaumarchaeota archaeon]|nr:hypothetical protein [Nitrososphaerota archaeon]
MISNNAKKLPIAAAAVLLVAMSVVGFDLVSGQADRGTEAIGTTVLAPEPVQREAEDRTRLNELEAAFDNAKTDEERERILAEASTHLREPTSLANPQRTAQYTEVSNLLTLAITDMPKQENGHAAVPFTRIGYSEQDGMLVVRIHQDFSTLDNMKAYEKIIRGVIGNEIDLKLVHGGDYWVLAECPNGPLEDCDPLESGIEMQVVNHNSCTIGMRATYDNDAGYVTAGHCADGDVDGNVGQDSISSVIGTVSKETYDKDARYETCDCAFIEIESGDRDMDPEVYWQSYYPTSAAHASLDDYVKIYGKGGMTYGYVTDTCDNVPTRGGPILWCVVVVDNDAKRGDSGAYVAQTFDPTPEFHGILVAVTSQTSAYVKHTQFTTNFSGLEWDFS